MTLERCKYCGGELATGQDFKESNLVIVRCKDCGRINEVI